MKPRTADSYRRALLSFSRSLHFTDIALRDITTDILSAWVADMVSAGHQPSTIRFYFDNLRSLYNKAVEGRRASELADPFAPLLSRLHAPAAKGLRVDVSPEQLNRVAVQPADANSAIRLVRDAFFYALCEGGLTLDQIVERRSNEASSTPQAAAIAAANLSAARSYLFPLRQGRRTNRQIALELARKTFAWLVAKKLPLTEFADSTARAIWIDVAVKIGIDPAAVCGCFAETDLQAIDTPVSLLSPKPLTADEIGSIRRRVADTICRNPRRWHAMRLRSGVTPVDIASRVETCGKPGVTMPETFYPTEEFVKTVGKKFEHTTRAFIADVLFFRSTDAEIAPLFSVIGDLAWCFRQTSAPGSPYAVISSGSMLGFQRMVGQFTPDMAERIEPLASESQLTPGRRVRVNGGIMNGYEGVIFDHPRADATTSQRLFQLRITADYGVQWIAEVPEIYIEPLDPS